MPRLLPGSLVALLAAVLLLAGCGGGDDGIRAAGPDPGPLHVHGLAVDPEDGSLLAATHTGLFRAQAGGLVRVGERRQDLMGFAVAGPGRFLASGHPDPEDPRAQGLPAHLGLLRSDDGGETWESVSLLGEADFHALRAYGDRVYGFDATGARLLVSDDGGATWEERRAPGTVLDLVAAPDDPDRLFASGEHGVAMSENAGATWRRVAPRVGFLEWPEGGPLYIVDVDGQTYASEDDGREWEFLGHSGRPPTAFVAAGPADLYVARRDGTIVRSMDGGRTWIDFASL